MKRITINTKMTKKHAKRVSRNQVTNCGSAADTTWQRAAEQVNIGEHAWELVEALHSWSCGFSEFPITWAVKGSFRGNGAVWCEILAHTVGDEHPRAFPTVTLNCHSHSPAAISPKRCIVLHVTREDEVFCVQVPSYFLILQLTVAEKKKEILNQETEIKICLSTPWSSGHLIFADPAWCHLSYLLTAWW